MVSGGVDNTLRVWDIETGKELFSNNEFSGHVTDVMFSSDGKLLIAASGPGDLKVWDTQDWSEIQSTLKPGISWSNALSPDGKILVARSN